MTAISAAISLATADAIQDPHLIWCFAAPSIIGFVAVFVFYYLFGHFGGGGFFVGVEEPAKSLDGDDIEKNSYDEKKVESREIKEFSI
jgi:hypothetical protein